MTHENVQQTMTEKLLEYNNMCFFPYERGTLPSKTDVVGICKGENKNKRVSNFNNKA